MCAQASSQRQSTARRSHCTQLCRSESLCDALRKELFSWHFSHPFRGQNPTSAVQISFLRTDLGLDLDAIACLEARDSLQQRWLHNCIDSLEKNETSLLNSVFFRL